MESTPTSFKPCELHKFKGASAPFFLAYLKTFKRTNLYLQKIQKIQKKRTDKTDETLFKRNAQRLLAASLFKRCGYKHGGFLSNIRPEDIELKVFIRLVHCH